MQTTIDYTHGICALDSGFIRPWLAAIHLIVEGDRAAIVDTATNHAVPRILALLEAKRIAPEQVDYVILTHIHLDHAGGAGMLMTRLPNARLCVHPRGARHMVDPSRLIEGTIAVYGEAHTRAVYGDIVPVPERRVMIMDDSARLALNGRELSFFDTPGHARHHFCIHDSRSNHVFAGDTFGLAYRELEVDGRRSVFPTTSPVQFDPPALHQSVERIRALQPEAVYVTHFGQVREIERLAADLHRLIDAHVALGHRYRGPAEQRHAYLKSGLEQLVLQEAERGRWPLGQAQLLDLFATDIELNAQGLAIWLDADG
jgi:glyoxylase-like metal-dependent hydrolase (beta-lactamase superfamily II)